MIAHRPARRMILDLTPILDVIMILLFGVMIHSVELSKVDTSELRTQAKQATEQSQTTSKSLEQAQAENELLRNKSETIARNLKDVTAQSLVLQNRIIEQRLQYSELMASLLQLDEPDRLTFKFPVTDDALKRQSNIDPEQAYKAIKRIEEMKKIFTFVDLHIDEQDFLNISVDAKRLDRMPGRSRSAEELENAFRKALESASFNDVVLILFSYESQSLDRTVETVETAIDKLLDHYRLRWSAKQFRYGRVGLVEVAPVTVKQE